MSRPRVFFMKLVLFAIAVMVGALPVAARAQETPRALVKAVVDAASSGRADEAKAAAYKALFCANPPTGYKPQSVQFERTLVLDREGTSFGIGESGTQDLIEETRTAVASLDRKVPWRTCGESSSWNRALPESIDVLVDNADELRSLHVKLRDRGALVPVDGKATARIAWVDTSDPNHYYAHVVLTHLDVYGPARAKVGTWDALARNAVAAVPLTCRVDNWWITKQAADGDPYLHADVELEVKEPLIVAPSEFVAHLLDGAGMSAMVDGDNEQAPPYDNAGRSFLSQNDPSESFRAQVDPAKDLGVVHMLTFQSAGDAHWTLSFKLQPGADLVHLAALRWGDVYPCAFAGQR